MLEVDSNSTPPRSSRLKVFMLWFFGSLAFLLVAASVALFILSKRFEPEARKWLLAAIQKRYESGVEIGAFHATLSPVPRATVEDIVIRFHGRTDLPPLAKIKKMTLEASLWGIRQKPLRISKLTLEGLEISIPPKEQRQPAEAGSETKPNANPEANFVLEEVIADGI
jgi:uncharacterized protein involved in outer membrane biogenesis